MATATEAASGILETRRRQIRRLDSVAGSIFTLGAIGFVIFAFVGRQGFDFGYVQSSYALFLGGLWITFYTTTISFALGMAIGFLVGWARTARPVPVVKILRTRAALEAEGVPRRRARLAAASSIVASGAKYYARRIADGYVEIIRGTPLFVQIIFAWSVLLVSYPRLDQLALIAGIAALTANTGGYQGEIFRAGLQTVHSGQVEAARAVGLSRLGAMRHVVFPQALRLITPPLTNEYIGLLKASSLLTLIGIDELTNVARNEAFAGFHIFEIFAMVVSIYLVVTVPFSKIVEGLERRFRIPGMGIQSSAAMRI